MATETVEILDRKFATITGGFRRIQRRLQEDTWYGTWKYSLDEIIDQRERLLPWAEKLGSDVAEWKERGSLTEEEEAHYHLKRGHCENASLELAEEIINREPDWVEWIEGMAENIAGFTGRLLEKLPILKQVAQITRLSRIKALPGRR